MTEAGDAIENSSASSSGISTEAASRIVAATGVELKEGIQRDQFCAALNYLVTEIKVRSLSRDPRSARRELERLKRSFDSYQKLANELPAYNLFPPKPGPVAV